MPFCFNWYFGIFKERDLLVSLVEGYWMIILKIQCSQRKNPESKRSDQIAVRIDPKALNEYLYLPDEAAQQ